jgi:hypothetical protein
MIDHWQYFVYDNILAEAKARLIEARRYRNAAAWKEEMDTLEYWTAWCAHANAIAVFTLWQESKGE